MPKPHPIELRERVVDHVYEGHTHRATAIHFRVSGKFVNDMVKLKRATGSLQAKPSGGRRGGGKLEPFTAFVRERVSQQGDVTLDQLGRDLHEQFDVRVHRSSIGRLLHRLGLSHKKRRFLPKNNIVQM